MNKEDSEGLLRLFFTRMSYKINKNCSNICGIKKYEDFICKMTKAEDLEGLDYRASLECFDRCLAKQFASSMVGVSKVHAKFEE